MKQREMKQKFWAGAMVALWMCVAATAQAQMPRDISEMNRWAGASLKPLAPSSPSPANGATGVSGTSVTLTWTSIGAISYEVRFGTTSTPPIVAGSVTTNSYVVSVTPGTKYFWRITGRNTPGATAGPVWTFTTAAPPPPPPPPPPAGLPVVPGAYGYGMQTRAAYGCGTTPAVMTVTNLNDSGAGSLRAAAEATVPRVVVFEVGGYVDLNDMIRVQSPCITVAGQTGPSPGITLRKYGIEVITHDVLLQHIRVRPGEWGQWKADNCGIIAYGGNTYNIVLDHVSVSWGPDENIAADTYYSGDMNMTVWRSIAAEGLDHPASATDSPSHGILVMQKSRKVAIIQNIMITNRERNPFMHGETSTAIINNVIYNAFAYWHFFFANVNWDGGVAGPWHSSIIENRAIGGANTDDDPSAAQGWLFQLDKTNGVNTTGNKLYRSGNTVENAQPFPFDACASLAPHSSCNEMDYDPTVVSAPTEAPISDFPTPMLSTDVEAFLKQHAGARPLDRDPIDARLMSDLTARTARGYRPHQDAYGGYPVMASTRRALTIPADPHTVTASGYTNLEDWLHGLAAAVGE
jgi:hypothetical protein